jgi:hypothetical protein
MRDIKIAIYQLIELFIILPITLILMALTFIVSELQKSIKFLKN